MHPLRADLRAVAATVVAATIICGGIAVASGRPGSPAAAAPASSVPATAVAPTTTTAPADAAVADPPGADEQLRDLDGEDLTGVEVCTLKTVSLAVGATGESVTCLQSALVSAGFYSGPVSGTFDAATRAAVVKMQEDRGLFVDGVVGRESGLALNIWPDEASAVIHTPPPKPGAVDSMGFRLSSVATTGADAPPLPANSGTGKRVVYDRLGQRVWAVSSSGEVIRSWLVAGSKYSNERPGTHTVYSRSEVSTAWNGAAYLPKMIRWLKTDIGAIGFHAIPLHRADRSPYHGDEVLGQRLSGGCQRQSNLDADFLWAFAPVGTKVVVT